MKKETRELLLKYDEVDCYEFPKNNKGFDYDEFYSRVRRLGALLSEKFKKEFIIDTQTQDASFFCDIFILKELVKNPKPWMHYSIRISNFGNLTTINFQSEYSLETNRVIIQYIKEMGFTFIEASELESDYDGKFEKFKHLYPNETPTWYIRYFDYL